MTIHAAGIVLNSNKYITFFDSGNAWKERCFTLSLQTGTTQAYIICKYPIITMNLINVLLLTVYFN